MGMMATVPRGGSWLFEDHRSCAVFSPERLSDEHRLMAKTADEFVTGEVMPALDRLESKDWALCRALVKRCGELGLLGVAAPEEYGGLDLDKAASLVVVERIARSASFGTTFGGQVEPVHPAPGPLRHGGAEDALPARTHRRRHHRRLRPQ